MKKMQKQSKITDLLALLVFAIFAVCVLLVLLTGAKIYRNLAEQGERNYDRRTAAGYITTRFRQSDGTAEMEDFGGCHALTFREQIEGETYLTRIYCYDGFLRELFASECGEYLPEDGEKILPLQGLSFEWDGDLLRVALTHLDGTVQELVLFHPGGAEVEP